MNDVPTPDYIPQSRERYLILALLICLTLAAWALLLWAPLFMQSAGSMGLTMGLGGSLFIAVWVVMMVAMMFPSAAPMILMFSRIYAGKQQERSFVPTWIFASAYLLVWVLFGIVAYIVAWDLEVLARSRPWLVDNAGRVGGLLLIAGGLYQLSPLKEVCLIKCRTPLDFIRGSWRSGYWGSFLMGLDHGFYCLGCCWLLFVILFPLGIMNVAAMAVLALLIFAEKTLPVGPRIARVAAVALVAYGVLVILAPGTLPTMSTPMPNNMQMTMPGMSTPIAGTPIAMPMK